MKKLLAFVVVAVCCVWLTGCPSSSTSPIPKAQIPNSGREGGVHVLKVSTNHESLTIREGSTADVKVSVTREPSSWDDDVNIVFKNLPKGVTAPADAKISKASKDGTFTLKAAGDAETVQNHGVMIEATSGDKTVEHPINITVKKN
jgi:hypothetical protein